MDRSQTDRDIPWFGQLNHELSRLWPKLEQRYRESYSYWHNKQPSSPELDLRVQEDIEVAQNDMILIGAIEMELIVLRNRLQGANLTFGIEAEPLEWEIAEGNIKASKGWIDKLSELWTWAPVSDENIMKANHHDGAGYWKSSKQTGDSWFS
ncbi:hypothetical protein M407DRAFT_32722 [Tulasnella calospora MUT 4182]|uniref:Uncharacterized protein n=1 Tax=Tulasnella calospora MUT 4182 TaxID=1051891 RepID=A0A0C3L7U3_9AGAM|nr:hypothetical protein M407DRAFT_32722 [Tulasnella calospora MUT 4182]